jgi:tripartite-type tricarboxylate transporter receptor subunit TctC
MSATRRQFLELAAAGAGITAALGFAPVSISGAAPADAYPGKTIKIVIPSAPGGPLDIPARLTAQALAKFGQPVVVEHRPGAAGAIGTREVVKAAPDGYTLLSGGAGGLAVLPAMSASTGFDPVKDLAAVAKVLESFQVVAVNPSSPWKSIADLVAHAKANPGKLNFAHVGTGHITHLAGELFMARTGVKLVGIPYRSGGESLTAVLGNSVQVSFENVAITRPQVAEGKLRALAVTSAERSPLAPDLPTMVEAGVGDYEVTTYMGIVAPAGTPATIVSKLNAAINETLATPQTQELMRKLGAVSRPGSPEDFAAIIAAHLQKWRTLGRTAGIKLD